MEEMYLINYFCSKCGKKNVKLWRQYQAFVGHIKLLCGNCALKDQGKNGPIDGDGCRESDFGKTDQIGWLVPAIPVDNTFWGYTSIPREDYNWWKQLKNN